MKRINLVLLFVLNIIVNAFSQSLDNKSKKVTTQVKSENHLSSSILLWMRKDKPRQEGMDRWKGPHAKIISANKGLLEYRQIHMAEHNTGLWPKIQGVETSIPQERKMDGVADVTLKNFFSIFKGKEQNRQAFADEINLFKRTILYAAFPKNSKWFNVAESNTNFDARAIVFFRIKEGVKKSDFRQFIMDELTPGLANLVTLQELRSKAYNPCKQKQWNTSNVEHDNVKNVQFQASVMLGFVNKSEMDKFFKSEEVKNLSERIAIFCSAVHAYEISETITFLKEGKQIK